MKAVWYSAATPDRIATLEEVWQVIDLLGRVTGDQGLVHIQMLEFSLPLAGREAPANAKSLWIDISEADAAVQALEASPETLAELFADRCGLVN